MRRILLVAAAVALTGGALAAPATAAPVAAAPAPHPAAGATTQQLEVFAPDGRISRAEVTRPAADRAAAPMSQVAAANVITIQDNGPSSGKFDLVFVGDGFTSTQQNTYDQEVRSKVEELFAVEPYKSYRSQFNVWEVQVVSAESGVTNDPNGTRRNTALGMYFYCGNIARLLCVNETKASQYAAAAPDVDQVVAVGNTSTYGGAGGVVATVAGGNSQAGQITVHELGHTIGDLADEYDYGTCDPSEGDEPNASTYTASQQQQYQTKWYRWIGKATPDGGTIGAYVGARYCTSGMYRPSNNSIMRTLGRQFNSPSREAMVAGFYRESSTINGRSSTASTTGGRLLTVDVADVHPTIRWIVDGHGVAGATGTTLDTGTLHLAAGTHVVRVQVSDPTPWVVDPALRKSLTRSVAWSITVR